MLSPAESISFEKCVWAAFNDKEYVSQWERLRERKLTGNKAIGLFIRDVRDLIFDRLPKDDCRERLEAVWALAEECM